MLLLTLFIISFITTSSETNPHYRLSITPSGKAFFRVGDTLLLNCHLNPIDAKIFPLRLSLPINSPPLENRMIIYEEPNNLTVTIKSLEINDTGWYNCEAEDRTSPIAKSTYVTIQAEYKGECPQNTFFSCGDRLCIPKRYVCDGFTDCPNDKDESVDLCGSNPCDNKIPCEDGRCIPKKYCCIRSLDSSCAITNLVPCCTLYLDQLATIKPVTELTLKDNLIRSTVYTIASCAVAVFFFVAILIVAIYRVHMRRALLIVRTHPNPNSFGSNAQRNTDHCIYGDSTNEMFEPIDPIDFELAFNQYETDDMMLSISQIPKPPLYSEALNHPIMPYNEPPPPYSPQSTPTSVLSPELEGTSSNSETPEETSYVLVIPMNDSQDSNDTDVNNSSTLTSD